MIVEIKYCLMCGGSEQAEQIASEIKKYFGIEPKLVDVGKGRLEVWVNDAKIWEKRGQTDWRPFQIVKLMRRLFKGDGS
jgi:predicted Rdx family selenoprotein